VLLRLAFQLPSYLFARTGGFVAYLVSAQVVAEGGEAAPFYDDDLFRQQIALRGYAGRDIYYPTAALLFLPICWLGLGPARALWSRASPAQTCSSRPSRRTTPTTYCC